jgi:prepilin-type processing-associated H-X9-DG protein
MWGPNRLGNWSAMYVGFQNSTVRETVVNSLVCPSDSSATIDTSNADEIGNQRAAGTSYVGNVGDNCLACNPGANVVTFCASQGFNCRGSQLGDPPTATVPPQEGTGSGIFWRQCNGVRLAAITDGTSGTFLAGEQIMRVTNWNAWVEANQSVGSTALPLNYLAPNAAITPNGSVQRSNGADARGQWTWWYSFRSQHPGGGNFAMADGSVKFIKNSISMPVYQALSTRGMGEAISSDAY